MYPNVWRHGDWLRITRSGSCIIYGRSDATINRHGLRMGTSELYSAVEALPEVLDSMVVDLEYLGRESYMPLSSCCGPACRSTPRCARASTTRSRRPCRRASFRTTSCRWRRFPRTLSGKKQELPIKKLLLGQPIEKVVNREAMANPGCLQWYIDFAAVREAAGGAGRPPASQ
jgi:acetoacetyl-CoA synthetase